MKRSIWKENSTLPQFKACEGELTTDILIIGGGLAGILTAYLLQKNGANYILVEGERICGATTGNTTAKITSQHGFIYGKLLDSKGRDYAKAYLNVNEKAVKMYREICGNIDCDFEEKDNFVYSVSDKEKLEKELNALNSINYNAELVENLPIPIKTVGAVKFKNQAQFNPLKFVAEISKGLNIYENTYIRKIKSTTAFFDNGKIKSQKIIIATHFPFINRHGSYFLKLYQHRSYCLALENAQDVGGMYVDEAETGFSFRNYGNHLILGGGDHRTGKKGGNWHVLEDLANKNYPNSSVKYMWSAQDCKSLDDVPYIGNYSALTPNLYVATGFNKWGMSSSMVSAMILSDLVTGKQNEYAEIFSPSRSILKPQLLVNGAEAVSHLINFSTKRCSHMGCALKWNPVEHTWDCPCHGSRYTSSGKVLENPAMHNKNLSRPE
ncbi:MAG: FAD-dependent oxidoreductase [Acutalibacteraceae bacterium]